ncbi:MULTISPECIES: Mu transposase C-terminal domain-containing protein [unclassified Neorhizobium]|uniref:Mu transposase C-terminal domain-containing protein n=1 Tax=unclassified Neorhizobium TaxID=2629175 RepID=UPI002867B7B6|nr:Mu transposase C-terminal domain-containing protein [Neorhizobium sp. SHOUNA12A]
MPLSFLPSTTRQLSPQGLSMFALHYYAPWLGSPVPDRDRLGKLEVRYDPRDISHIYVRHPETRSFRPVERRDGCLEPMTLWEHDAHRAQLRAANHRSSIANVTRSTQHETNVFFELCERLSGGYHIFTAYNLRYETTRSSQT